MDTAFWQKIVDALMIHRPVTLLVVVQSLGSSPGRVGFKMAVTDDDLWGSIGGGLMEMNMVTAVRAQKESDGVVKLRRQVHRKNAPEASGMICSGEQTIVSLPLLYKDLGAIIKIANGVKNRCGGLSVRPTGLHFLEESPTSTHDFSQEGRDFTYTENLDQRPLLLLIGGGHCGLALSELMSRLGFFVHLFDNRPDLNTIAENHFADQITIADYNAIAQYLPECDQAYVVVMTFGFATDELVMRQLLGRKFAYFGVLGSATKMKTLLQKLKKDGFSPKMLSEIRTPIGLPIHSKTPMEIAVSIAAEIIQTKNRPHHVGV
ncbi:MAG: XdhC family protein [Rhodothermia bacterium]|nr:XdhC family protein [Rhodothermia bacterium]